MRKRWPGVLVAVMFLAGLSLLAFGDALFAQVQPTTTTVTDTSVVLAPGALKIALVVLAQGLLVSKMIDGLKNTPLLANVFEKYGWLGAISNGLLSFFVAAPLCLAAGGTLDLNCLLAAVMTFLSASGFHLARVKANTPPVIDAAGKISDAPSPSVSRKTLDDLGIKPVK
jgi:hypothetical protein